MTKIIAGPGGQTSEMNYQEFLNQVQENWRKRLQGEWSSPEPVEAQCQQIKRCTEIALSCMELDRHKRPSIVDIIHELNETEVFIEENWRLPQDELIYNNLANGFHEITEQVFGACPMSISFPYHSEQNVNLGSIDWITSDIMHKYTEWKQYQLDTQPECKQYTEPAAPTEAPLWQVPAFGGLRSGMEMRAGFEIGETPGFPQEVVYMSKLRKLKIWLAEPSQKNLDGISQAFLKLIRDGTNEHDLNRSVPMDFQKYLWQFMNTITSDVGKMDLFVSFMQGYDLDQLPLKELCLWSTGLSWRAIQDGLSKVRGLKYLKLIEDNLGRVDILFETEHLKAIDRIYIECKRTLEVAIAARPMPKIVSVHILCQDLHVVHDNPLFEMTRMANLKEVVLHNQVESRIRAGLVRAADAHRSRPKVLFLEYPTVIQTSELDGRKSSTEPPFILLA
ncbi:disease resistance protein RGA4-like isoform X1 [Triticum dicoccoides]|uniref:disease resistance protein RGA4-like isoform X1 n=1 Tax=Triticum dicoccoides TaxID=85692 RepID=UPI000E7C4143|nr:disease resistance protein RGA4-like isoform X1 [Triticum dicoccoides]XP_037488266.1 disease resistance protein RGA4-like isoform X1 [Triticum dicoccoides]XP_037488267.1 disease resistance protein RGA4-like isoform X1 [Triticum dicoccoides]